MAMVFQDPMTSLNPVKKIGTQLTDPLRYHLNLSRDAARKRSLELLELVRIPEATRRLEQYPHELSGGMRQRVMIAIALTCNPKLLIADEPTTALDVTVQKQILDLLNSIQREFEMAMILITHDLGVVADVAQTVMVMYAGRPMELGTRDEVFSRPLHPYTWGLLESMPRVDQKVSGLTPIPGSPPSLIFLPPGCPFHARCPHRFAPCDQERPELRDRGGGHAEACHLSADDKRRLWAERQERFLREAV
jgi:peptide/nickel transport system ATP-binding protein